MVTAAKNVLLVQASEMQEKLLQEALASQGVQVTPVPPYAHLETEIKQALRAQPECLLVALDLGVLAQLATSLAAFASWARHECTAAKLVLTCGNLVAIRPAEKAWARSHGALDLLPGCSGAGWREHLAPVARVLLSALGTGPLDEPRLARALSSMPKASPGSDAAADAYARLARLEELGVPAGDLTAQMRGRSGVEVRDRPYHLTTYPECFVGSEAVDWIVRETGLERAAAVEAGRTLFETGEIYHVVREQPFLDGFFFYRFAANSARLDALDLAGLLDRLRGASGIAVQDRNYHGATFPACFVGAEAVRWLTNAAGLSLNEAMTLGQRLIDLFVIHHVTDEHGFKNGHFFYRFYEDEPER